MNSKELLNSVLVRSQQDRARLQSMQSAPMSTALRNSLEKYANEIISIEAEAFSIAASRGWTLNELPPISRAMICLITRLRLFHLRSDSMLASAVIQGNMKSVIQGIRDRHRAQYPDPRVASLLQKHLDCHRANIRQIQEFL